MEVFDDKFRTFEIASKAGLLGRMFGRHSSDQNLALPISTIGLMNAGNVWMSERFTQSTALIDTGAPHSQAQQLHCQVKEQSSRSCDDGMEFDDESPQRNLSNSPATMGSRQKLLREGMQASGGLMRYHSAPSSMLASLVEVGEDFFPHVSSPLRHNGDTDFAQLFVDDLKTSATNCEKRSLQQTQKPLAGSDLNSEQMLAKQLDRARMLHQQSRYKRPLVNGVSEDGNLSPLSAIYEHGPDISPGNFCGTQMSATCNQQGARAGLAVGMGNLGSQRSSCNPLVTPATSYSSLPQNKTNLIRHSSSPAGLLSRLAMEVQGESCERPTPCFSGPMMHHPPECLSESASKEICFSSACRVPGLSPAFSERSCFGASIAAETSDDIITSDGRFMALSPSSKSRLVRQSSSPAGLLSQMSPDGIAEGGDKLMMPSSSGNSAEESNFDGRGGPTVFLTNYAAGNWDEHVAATGSIIGMQNDTAFAARKRVRELESKMFPGLTLSADSQQMDDFDHGGSLASQFGMAGTTSPENGVTADKFLSDYVTCRARAKRGCATHPRSIAERVRRTKISERMRKLQELVPNMDKQTNTADMLDEAVEYVKLLQRQVKELSENRPKCDGCCRQKGNDPHQD